MTCLRQVCVKAAKSLCSLNYRLCVLEIISYLSIITNIYIMILRSITILAFLLTSLSLKAQFHITPQVGVTFASMKLSGDNHSVKFSDGYDETNLVFGVMASKQVSSDFGLQADFFYTQRGTEVDYDRGLFIDLVEINTSHLDLGMQMAYSCIDNLSFEAGLYYSFLLEGRERYDWGGSYIPEMILKREYKNETGGSIGLSYTIYNITARAKYSFGVWGTREFEKHRWFLLTLGYRFEV